MATDRTFRRMQKFGFGALMLLAILSIVSGAAQTPCAVANCKATGSYIKIVSGTLADQTIDATNSEITVPPKSPIYGSFSVSVKNNAQLSDALFITVAIPNWGDHEYSYWYIASRKDPFIETQTIDVDLRSPSTLGTYYIIVAGAWEPTDASILSKNDQAGLVASATDYNAGEIWGYDDLADWSVVKIERARSSGIVITNWKIATDNWKISHGNVEAYVPATAVKINVQYPTKGSISISSSPSGASIFLDNIEQGKTPKTITDVSEGSHFIELKLKDYYTWSDSINVAGGSTFYITEALTLKPTTPTVTATTFIQPSESIISNFPITPTVTAIAPTPSSTKIGETQTVETPNNAKILDKIYRFLTQNPIFVSISIIVTLIAAILTILSPSKK